jgi:aerobic-type carbon monoxide dehydrogenase small subunit (CoxS/CutS family)
MIVLQINGEAHSTDASDDTPLLWVLRDHLGLTGTKFGCGIGLCGACTVHLDGAAVRSCTVPVGAAARAQILTIEGLATGPDQRLFEAWIAEQVPQCGYCQPGMLMAVAALLRETPLPSDAQIDASITNLCRCGTYPRIRRAIQRAARSGAGVPLEPRDATVD